MVKEGTGTEALSVEVGFSCGIAGDSPELSPESSEGDELLTGSSEGAELLSGFAEGDDVVLGTAKILPESSELEAYAVMLLPNNMINAIVKNKNNLFFIVFFSIKFVVDECFGVTYII